MPQKSYQYMLKTGMLEWPPHDLMLKTKDPKEWIIKSLTFYEPLKTDSTEEKDVPMTNKRKGVIVESQGHKSHLYSYEKKTLEVESSYSFELEENETIKYVQACKKCQQYTFLDQER